MPSFHDQVFFNTRKSLAHAARLDVVACISAVQRKTAVRLSTACAAPATVLLATADLTETLMAREALVFASQESYATLRTVRERANALDAALACFLLQRLVSNLPADQRKLVRSAFQGRTGPVGQVVS